MRRTVGDDVLEPEQGVAVGTTLEEAIEGALAILGAREDEVDVEILEEGRRSFLGIGRGRPYRVRVTWREDDDEVIEEDLTQEETAKAVRPGGRSREERRDRPARDVGRAGGPPSRTPRRDEPVARRAGRFGERSERGDRSPRPAPARDAGPRSPRRDSMASPRDSAPIPRDASVFRRESAPPARPERPREVEPEPPRRDEPARAGEARWSRAEAYRPLREPAPPVARDETALPTSRAPRSGPPRVAEALSTEELRERARQITDQLMRDMGMEARVSGREHEGDVWIDVESDVDDALLIGRRGETRNAIQHIVQRLLGPRAESSVSVIVDVNSYWQRRMARLVDEARGLAEDAVATGREQRTEPLTAQERRIVHRALSEDGRVRTESHGDGEVKRVSITRA